tara:strand:- start:1182 stop:1391 length:210 start_codon:yes stop_codon:yes gene_type:complete
MKIGDKINFYLFGVKEEGIIYNIDKKEKTVSVKCNGYNYSDIITLKKLPKKRSDNPSHKSYVPPWYILK